MRLSMTLLVVVALLQSSPAMPEELAPLEDYATPEDINGLHLSPSGSRFTYHLISGNREVVPVVDVATGRVLDSLGVEESVLERLGLVRDDTLLLGYEYPSFYGEAGDIGFSHIKTLNIETGAFHRIKHRGRKNDVTPESFSLSAVGVSPNQDFLYLPGRTRANRHQTNLYLYDLEHGLRPRSQAQGTGSTVQWFAKGSGERFVREDFDYKKSRHTVVIVESGNERVLYRKDIASREIDVVGVTRDWRSLIFRTQGPGAEGVSYHPMSLLDGSTGGPLVEHESGTTIIDKGGAIVGFESGQEPDFSYKFLDEGLASLFARARRSIPDAKIRFVSSSRDLKHIVVRASSDWSAEYYMLFSADSELPKLLAKEEKKIPRSLAAPRRAHNYKDEGGRSLRALVTARPETLQAGNSPAIILNNWQGNDFVGRDLSWIAQYFSSRGYVVVQPEVRGFQFNGSFSPQGVLEWRAAPERDADAVIAKLAGSGIVDAKRMCTIGVGQGGFTALTLGYRSAYDFRCVAALDAPTDLSGFVSRVSYRVQHTHPRVKGLQRRYGFESTERESIAARSPLTHAAEYSAPVLLAFFKKDDEIYERQAKSMAKALDKSGNDVTLLKIEGDDIHMRQTESRTAFLTAVAELVSANLPP